MAKHDAKSEATTKNERPLSANGPTLEEFVAAGYAAEHYPPRGYAEKPSAGLTKFRDTGEAPTSKPHDLDAKTHIVARSRNASFRRAGLKFGPDYRVYSIDEITEAKAKIIEAEPMLDARRISAMEASRFAEGAMPEDDETVTKAELRQFAEQYRERAERAEKQLDELRAKFAGADFPPKRVEDLPGMPPARG